MPLPRLNVMRSGAGAARALQPRLSISRTQLWQHFGRRTYSDGGATHTKKAGSDIPWFLGSVAITAPITYYLLQQTPTDDGGHGHGHGEEHEEGGEHEDGDSDDNTEGDAGESEESSSDEDQATPDTSEDEESNEESETVRRANSDVNFKGPTEGGPAADERSHIPDAKGGAKLGISSAYGQKQGEGEQTGDESEGENLDKGATAKEPISRNHQSGKQEGISDTDTKDSTDITNDSEQSHKGEGGPETA